MCLTPHPFRRRPLDRRLSPLAAHRVLGPLDREPGASQEAPDLIDPQGDAGGLLEVLGQPGDTPGAEAVAEVLGRGPDRLEERRPVTRGGTGRPPGRLGRSPAIEAGGAVATSDA